MLSWPVSKEDKGIAAALISTVALAILAPLSWPPLVCAFQIGAPARLTSSAQQQQQQSSGFTFNHQHNHRQSFKTKSDSSSSFFSTIEDLSDSNIKSRTSSGVPIISRPPIELAGDPSLDFDRLLKRILDNGAQQHRPLLANNKQQSSQPTTSADANNKTTMRFFRNNKTFASIVYTNERSPLAPATSSRPAQGLLDQAEPRRLINCHLVDLEKHSADVALFETKYDIRTLDIEFRDMMQLIDACTNIARFRPFLVAKTASGSQQTGAPKSPLLVVGRPPGAPLPNSLATFNNVMSDQLNQQLTNLGPTIDDSSKLDLPEPGEAKPPDHQVGRFRRGRLGQATDKQQQQKEARAGRANKKAGSAKLVLSEVTPPPNQLDDGRGGIKEALQEITSYDTTDLMSIWRGILPGTNWCGMGDRATSYNDLGFESDIDICCRAHDFCPIRLSAFSSGYGLFNWSFYTRSHCWCDQNFLDCLQRAKSPLSSVVMKFYFTIMKTTCLSDNEANLPSLGARRSQLGTKSKQGNQFGPIQATQQQQQILYDQIRASMPIPAQRQSQLVQAKLELNNNSMRRN